MGRYLDLMDVVHSFEAFNRFVNNSRGDFCSIFESYCEFSFLSWFSFSNMNGRDLFLYGGKGKRARKW